LRGLKNALLYAKVAEGQRDEALPDDRVISILSKEAKKRQESADMYSQAGETERAQAELSEKAVIEEYLPARLSEAEIGRVVDQAISELEANDLSVMGKVIGEVKQKTAGAADGAVIARIVKERLGGNK
jgi:uncharacterized protein YqeY